MLVVSLPYDPDWAAVDWAKEHCPSYITNDAHIPRTESLPRPRNKVGELVINYYFGSEEDATLFALRWL